nr:MAG TPA: hypothetical protein [Caudoviricetes sp.]DAZ79078.1 MAG TPA: hypothetical protein [Caudoviricetes sp.]
MSCVILQSISLLHLLQFSSLNCFICSRVILLPLFL